MPEILYLSHEDVCRLNINMREVVEWEDHAQLNSWCKHCFETINPTSQGGGVF